MRSWGQPGTSWPRRSEAPSCGTAIFTASQHGGVGRDLWGPPAQPPAQAGSPRAGCTAPRSGGAGISPEKETPQPPWAAWARAPAPSEGGSSSSSSSGTPSHPAGRSQQSAPGSPTPKSPLSPDQAVRVSAAAKPQPRAFPCPGAVSSCHVQGLGEASKRERRVGFGTAPSWLLQAVSSAPRLLKNQKRDNAARRPADSSPASPHAATCHAPQAPASNGPVLPDGSATNASAEVLGSSCPWKGLPAAP